MATMLTNEFGRTSPSHARIIRPVTPNVNDLCPVMVKSRLKKFRADHYLQPLIKKSYTPYDECSTRPALRISTSDDEGRTVLCYLDKEEQETHDSKGVIGSKMDALVQDFRALKKIAVVGVSERLPSVTGSAFCLLWAAKVSTFIGRVID